MLKNIHELPNKNVSAIEWHGDPLYYDLQLYELGEGYKEFWALNPNTNFPTARFWIDKIPETRKCIVFTYQGEWIVKIFKEGWYPYHGYETFEIFIPQLTWSRNPDIDSRMTFDFDPRAEYKLEKWDQDYELYWTIDPRFNPLDTDVWLFKAIPTGRKLLGTKHMGHLTPNVELEINGDVLDFNLNIDELCPPYYNLDHTNVYYLDRKHTPFSTVWIAKFYPSYRSSIDVIDAGVISPEPIIEVNPDLPNLNFDIDYDVPYHDLAYEHVWMLDEKHLKNAIEPIWAVKLRYVPDSGIVGTKVIGSIGPQPIIEINSELQSLNLNIDYDVPHHDLAYEHVWMLDKKYTDGIVDPIWVAKLKYTDDIVGIKEMPPIELTIKDQLDVIFISYQEPNAENNWKRLLEKAPWAKRVDGVKGIFNAHKEAARLSTTDMFYVVDGDAYVDDAFKFDFQPNIFDRDCSYVWYSKNPVNDLVYENGGIKLFPKQELLKIKSWKTLDMFTGITKKKKVIKQVSCVATYNSNEFNTWKSAFRESVKLFTINNITQLDAWLSKGEGKLFGEYSIAGAKAGAEFAKKNLKDPAILNLINDYKWLREKFNQNK